MLTVIRISQPSHGTTMLSTARRNRSAANSAPSISVCGSNAANSSPPMRPSRSSRRNPSAMRRARQRSASSPTWCPYVSFTRLKWSMSIMSSDVGVRCRNARFSSIAERSMNERLLRISVRSSISASRTSAASSSFRRVMSLTPIRRTVSPSRRSGAAERSAWNSLPPSVFIRISRSYTNPMVWTSSIHASRSSGET